MVFANFRKLIIRVPFFIYFAICSIIFGAMVAVFGATVPFLIFVALWAFFVFVVFLQMRYKVYYATVLLIISTTVARESFGLPFETDILCFILLLATLLIIAPKQFLHRKNYVLILPVIGYLGINFITTFFVSPAFNISFRQNLILVYRAMIFFTVIISVRNLPNIRFSYHIWFQRILFVNVVFSSFALVFYQFLPTTLVHAKSDSTFAIKGTFQESNLLGVFALTVTAMSLSTYFYSPKQGTRSIFYVIIGIIGMVLSLTRSTWLGFILILAVSGSLLILKSKKSARTKYLILATLAILCLSIFVISIFILDSFSIISFPLISTISERFAQIFDLQTNSAFGRIQIWRNAIELWLNHLWLGSGLLTYGVTSRIARNAWLYNFVIQSLHDSGILGTFFLLIFLLSIIWISLKGYIRASNNYDKGTMLGYLLGIIGLLFTSLTSSFIWSAYAWVLFGLAAGHSLIVINQTSASYTRN